MAAKQLHCYCALHPYFTKLWTKMWQLLLRWPYWNGTDAVTNTWSCDCDRDQKIIDKFKIAMIYAHRLCKHVGCFYLLNNIMLIKCHHSKYPTIFQHSQIYHTRDLWKPHKCDPSLLPASGTAIVSHVTLEEITGKYSSLALTCLIFSIIHSWMLHDQLHDCWFWIPLSIFISSWYYLLTY